MQPIIFPVAGVHMNLNGTGIRKRGVAPNFCGCFPLPVLQRITISGVTKDAAGAPLGGCVVQLFRTVNDSFVEETVSDGSGNYSFSVVGLGQLYYVVAYKAGAPDVAGTTVNTLVGA